MEQSLQVRLNLSRERLEKQFKAGNKKAILFHLIHLTEHLLHASHFQIYDLTLTLILLYIRYFYTHFQMGQVTFSEIQMICTRSHSE